MVNQDFELYYYSDEKFEPVELHRHSYYEIYLPLEGDIYLDIDGVVLPLTKTDVVVVPAGQKHRIVNVNPDLPYRRFIFWLNPSFMEKYEKIFPEIDFLPRYLKETNRFSFHFSNSDISLIHTKFLRCLEEIHSHRFAEEGMLALGVFDLLLTLSRLAYETVNPSILNESDDLFQNIISYIEQNLEDNLSLDELANHFFVSKYYISHFFKETVGISIHQYILKKRLEKAKSLMISGASIKEAFKESGFSDYSSFFRAFRKEYHLSPKEFQKVYIQDPIRLEKKSH